MPPATTITNDVGEEAEMLKAVFLPYPITSHIIRIVDTARLFATYGVDITIITTPGSAKVFQSSIDHDSARGNRIRTHLVNFPEVPGLPQGVETFNSHTPQHLFPKLMEAISLLQDPIQQLFRDIEPDFIVFDIFFPWSADAAAELGIPSLIYLGGSYTAMSAHSSVEQFAPHTKVDSDTEPFLLPGLPHELKMTRLQLPVYDQEKEDFESEILKAVEESKKKSYGSLLNSFSEIEGIYEEHYKSITGTKSWGVGPVSLWMNQDASDKGVRGGASEEREPEGWLNWLDSKTEDSVLYLSFGSMNKFSTPQLVEIAHALDDFGHDFIWVVEKFEEQGEFEGENGFLKEFENRVVAENRGYLIRGWAPQLLILEHPAIGGVVTHCGWNTILESVIAGLPMATMPLFAEQFYNEKLLVDVLGIGVSVGVKKWKNWFEVGDEVVKREDIVKAIGLLMGGGEEAMEMRRRARDLGDAAKKTIQPGGSSHTKVKELLHELKTLKLQKLNHKIKEGA